MANLQLQLKRETERLEAMRAHLDPNRKTDSTNEEKISPKSVNTENELTGARWFRIEKLVELLLIIMITINICQISFVTLLMSL